MLWTESVVQVPKFTIYTTKRKRFYTSKVVIRELCSSSERNWNRSKKTSVIVHFTKSGYSVGRPRFYFQRVHKNHLLRGSFCVIPSTVTPRLRTAPCPFVRTYTQGVVVGDLPKTDTSSPEGLPCPRTTLSGLLPFRPMSSFSPVRPSEESTLTGGRSRRPVIPLE